MRACRSHSGKRKMCARQSDFDLVVHWEDAAFASPLRIKDTKVRAEPVGKNLRASMRRKVLLYRGHPGWDPGDAIAAKDLSVC